MSNAYASLPAFSVDPPDNNSNPIDPPTNAPSANNDPTTDASNTPSDMHQQYASNNASNASNNAHNASNDAPKHVPSKFKQKALRRFLKRQLKRDKSSEEAKLIDDYITWAEDERTALAKLNTDDPKFAAIENAHDQGATSTSVLQQARNLGYNLRTNAKRAIQTLLSTRPHVRFADNVQVCTFSPDHKPFMVTYDSGADGHYISEKDRHKANLPILRKSKRRVGVANGNVCLGKNVTRLPIPQLNSK